MSVCPDPEFRSVYVDRTLEFVAKFACTFLEKKEEEGNETEGEKEEEEQEEMPLFLFRLFAWLLDHHEVTSWRLLLSR